MITQQYIKERLTELAAQRAKAQETMHLAATLILPIVEKLSEDAYLWLYETADFTVTNRDDLALIMSVEPGIWTKSNNTYSIQYMSPSRLVAIEARDAALPSTCVEIEEEVVEEARPERRYTRKVVKCTVPVRDTVADAVVVDSQE